MAQAQSGIGALAPGSLTRAGLAALAIGFGVLVALVPVDPALFAALWFLPAVGVLGAIIANSSGTGGGVVFVPVFNALSEHGVMEIAPIEIVGVSMAIQSFGMTIGALRWIDRLYHPPAPVPAPRAASVAPRDFFALVAMVCALGVPALLATQRLVVFDAHAVLLGYKAFSVVLGLVLIAVTWTIHLGLDERSRIAPFDWAVLALIAIPGGAITALFSVGIGELVALYLFIRHYPIVLCSGAACAISAISVLAGVVWHIEAATIRWEVVLWCAPAAVAGAFVSRPIALWLGARRLKTLSGVWIVVSALYLLWLNRG